MLSLAILFGAAIGFALGMTGSGGGIFAVPLLVFGLHIAPREAVGVSLAAVGGTALCGVLPRWGRGEVEIPTGALFALFGMFGAPVGNRVSRLMSEQVLLLLFSGLMLLIASRMWQTAGGKQTVDPQRSSNSPTPRRICQRSADGRLQWTTSCGTMLASLGFATGILSGMFGVGGGFIIVPALVLFSGMEIHDAVGTSLMVIVLVSISGVSSYLLSGGQLSLQITGLFVLGGFLGMQLGSRLSRRLSGPLLQRIFAAAVVSVAMFVIVKSTILKV